MNASKDKEALKQLRENRRFYIERAKKTIKEQNQVMTAVKTRLKTGAATVPAIAADLKMESARVLVIISALRKYGEVAEGAKDGAYFTYQLITEEV